MKENGVSLEGIFAAGYKECFVALASVEYPCILGVRPYTVYVFQSIPDQCGWSVRDEVIGYGIPSSG